MAYFNNSNKPFLCERNKGKVFVLERRRILLQKRNKGIGFLLFSDGEKVAKKPPCGDSPRSSIWFYDITSV